MKKIGLIIGIFFVGILLIQVILYFLSVQSVQIESAKPVEKVVPITQLFGDSAATISTISGNSSQESVSQKIDDKPIYEQPIKDTILLY